MPPETRNHTIAIALVFDLEHHALVGFVAAGHWLRHYAIQPGALEAAEPIRRDLRIARGGSEMKRRPRLREESLQHLTAALKGRAAQIAIALAQQIEKHDRGGSLARKEFYPRLGRMNPHLQRFEI